MTDLSISDNWAFQCIMAQPLIRMIPTKSNQHVSLELSISPAQQLQAFTLESSRPVATHFH
jgi:hypothetical protein